MADARLVVRKSGLQIQWLGVPANAECRMKKQNFGHALSLVKTCLGIYEA